MNAEPTLGDVLTALRALYHSPDTGEKERASNWLEQFQRSVYAWTISDQLLAEKQNLESCYFAAQTMRTKIQYHFSELPLSSHSSLRDSLLNHIMMCDTNTNNIVAMQLCLALADLALLMATWKNAVTDLLTRFAPHPHTYPVLLDLLTVLPEEICSRTLRLGKNRRSELVEELSTAFAGVHQFLSASMNHYIEDPRFCAKILKCLGSWFSAGVVPESQIMGSPLLDHTFHFLANAKGLGQLHQAATDCLCAALVKCEDLNLYGQLAVYFLQRVIALHQCYSACAANEDTDRCLNFARIFTEMSESYIEPIVLRQTQGLGDLTQLEVICLTLDHDSFEVADISFNFWYQLADKIYQKDDKILNSQFAPFIQKVIISLCKHVQLDPDLDGLLEKSDDFYDFRLRAGDLIKDIVFIVGSVSCLCEMYTVLQKEPLQNWNTLEAALFIISSVARCIVPEEEQVVPHVVDFILSQLCSPSLQHHVALTNTCIVLMGELCEWIQLHTSRLDAVLQFLLACLHNEKLANTAAVSLELICAQCAEERRMLENFSTILEVAKHIDSFHITTNAIVQLMKGVSLVLSKFPAEQLAKGVEELCSYQVEPLKQLMQLSSESMQSKKRGTKHDPGMWVDRLTSIIRYAVPRYEIFAESDGHHPCYNIITNLWPVLSQVCDRYQEDAKIIEKCCRCIRFVIRNLGKSFTPLLNSLVTQMVTLYTARLHSCYLYLASIVVDEYGSETGCIQGLLDMTRALAMPTFELLSKPHGLVHHPDTVDDLFRLAMRLLQKNRLYLLSSSVMRPLLQCAVAASLLDHREANASVMRFFCELLAEGEKESSEDALARKAVSDLLTDEGAAVTNALLECCVSALPSYMMPDVADVLLALLKFDRTKASIWLEQSLLALPMRNSGGAITATPQQIKDFHTSVIRAIDQRDISPLLKDFSKLYR